MLYVDEAQNFITDFESILTEARKYRLSLVLITQPTTQLKDAASAVFRNTATKVSFRVSQDDAERLKEALTMSRSESELQDTPNYWAYVHTLKTSCGTRSSSPMSVRK